MASVILTQQPVSLTAVPGQDSSFTVTASADFAVTSYNYQWKVGGVNITGATQRTFKFDPLIGDNGKTFTVSVSALSGIVSQATILSNPATLTVIPESLPFVRFAYGNESGRERFTRLRHLGYV